MAPAGKPWITAPTPTGLARARESAKITVIALKDALFSSRIQDSLNPNSYSK
jgi:hypothetical protein